MWAIKLKDAIPEKYEPKRCHTKKVCAKLKRKRVKQWVQRHPPERKKWVQKSIRWRDCPHLSKDRKERILHKSLKI